MKRSKFTEPQIAFILRQGEGGTAVGEICRPFCHAWHYEYIRKPEIVRELFWRYRAGEQDVFRNPT